MKEQPIGLNLEVLENIEPIKSFLWKDLQEIVVIYIVDSKLCFACFRQILEGFIIFSAVIGDHFIVHHCWCNKSYWPYYLTHY